MNNPPVRSPRTKVGGLYHFGRMVDKIRLHLRDQLPDEYRPHFGLSLGLDGHLCGFLAVSHDELIQQVALGKSDAELLEWCFLTRFRPTPVQRRIWNGFARKFGWRDMAASYLQQLKLEQGRSRHRLRFDRRTRRQIRQLIASSTAWLRKIMRSNAQQDSLNRPCLARKGKTQRGAIKSQWDRAVVSAIFVP